MRLLANAGTLAEVEAALAAGAEGIGLLRTELAFLDADGVADRGGAPRAALAPLLAPLAHRIATVRTLDFGGDKTPPFLAATRPPRARSARAASGSRWPRRDGVAPQLRGALRGRRRTPSCGSSCRW